MLARAHPSPQPKRQLDRCSRFAGLTSVTDRPTDHATRSVRIGRIYVRSTAMRPNNDSSLNLYSAFFISATLCLRDICYGRLSDCLPQAGVLSKRLVFDTDATIRLSYTALLADSDIFSNNGTSFWNLVLNSELSRVFAMFATARRRSQVLSMSTDDRRKFITLNNNIRPPLFTIL